MRLRKFCSRTTPGCFKRSTESASLLDFAAFYDFRVNSRYRATTDTSDKQRAKDIEASERRASSREATASAGSRRSRSDPSPTRK